MTSFAVTYTYGAGTDSARDEVRPVHVDFLRAAFERGDLRISGPFADSGGQSSSTGSRSRLLMPESYAAARAASLPWGGAEG